MKNTLKVGMATLAVAGIAGIGSLSASALANSTPPQGAMGSHQYGAGQGGGRQASLESRAQIFGMSAAELESALQTKTMSQIAIERGMTEETFRAKMTEAAKARWEARGLSDEEIAKRIADRDARHAANAADHEFGSGEGNHQGGYGRQR